MKTTIPTTNQSEVMRMSADHDGVDPATSYYLGLSIICELEVNVDDKKSLSQLEQARTYLTKPSQEVEISESDSDPSEAMKIASSVAVRNGYNDLFEVADDFVCADRGVLVTRITHPELSSPIYSIAEKLDEDLFGFSESRVERRLARKGIEYNVDDINCGFMIPETATPKEVIEQHLPEGDNK